MRLGLRRSHRSGLVGASLLSWSKYYLADFPALYADLRQTKFSARHSLDWQACRLPLGITILKPSHAKAALAQQRHCLEGKYAIGAAAIGDDFAFLRQF